jgi:hypothetical protein
MSRRFLTPVNLPSGANLPSVGSVGDLFFKTTDQSVYSYTSSGWTSLGGNSLSELGDVSISSPLAGDILLYNSESSLWEATPLGTILYSEESAAWHRNNVLQVLLETALVSSDGGSYNTSTFAGTIDGGSYNTTSFSITLDGGSAGSI